MQTIAYLFALHFLADFVLQTRWMATNKSKHAGALMSHMGVYLMVLYGGCYWVPGKFAIVSALLHGLQDLSIWNLYGLTLWARRGWRPEGDFKYQDDPVFYATIGLDQALHYVALLWAYGWANGS